MFQNNPVTYQGQQYTETKNSDGSIVLTPASRTVPIQFQELTVGARVRVNMSGSGYKDYFATILEGPVWCPSFNNWTCVVQTYYKPVKLPCTQLTKVFQHKCSCGKWLDDGHTGHE